MADAHKRRANVDIDDDVHGVSKRVKADNDLKKLGDAVRMVTDHYMGRDDAPESENSGGEEDGGEERRRKINVREPFYSLEMLDERHGMLEYYTGFERPVVDLLIRRFSEVSGRITFFLSGCSAWRRPLISLPLSCSDLLTQFIKSDAPNRRQSNEGYRKLDLPERVMFLARIKRKVPFEELGYQYGCGAESARRYCGELVEIFVKHFVPRLIFPLPPAELKE
jgi:hypothetical protein